MADETPQKFPIFLDSKERESAFFLTLGKHSIDSLCETAHTCYSFVVEVALVSQSLPLEGISIQSWQK